MDLLIIIGYNTKMSSDRREPYIGVTGLVGLREARIIAQAFKDSGLTQADCRRRAMVGVLASPETLAPSIRKRVKYPSLPQIRGLLSTTRDAAFNTIHYNNYPAGDLAVQVSSLLDYDGLYTDKLCEGIQFNKPIGGDQWPPVEEISKIKQAYPELRVILQLGPRILRNLSPDAIVEMVSKYTDVTDYALIDPSAGRKRIFDVNIVSPLYTALREEYPRLALGFAGGFDPKNVHTRLWVLSQVIGSRDFSIDAEGGLRLVGKDPYSPTPISPAKARRYIYQASSFFCDTEGLLKTGS